MDRSIVGRLFHVAAWTLALVLAAVAPARAAESPAPPGMPDCRPERLRSLLAGADSCLLGKACGLVSQPWMYRGPRGTANRMRFYGPRMIGPEATRALAELMLHGAPIDSAGKVGPIDISCETGDSIPVYVASFLHGDSLARAVLRFDTGQVLFFTKDVPLGFVPMGGAADSLWSRLAATLDWDPNFARPRPAVPAPDPEPGPTGPGARAHVEELPVALVKVPPEYPDVAREAGVSGTVWVKALVGKGGTVRDVVVEAGPPILYDSTLDAVWQWTFKPARLDGVPLDVWVAFPVKYSLH